MERQSTLVWYVFRVFISIIFLDTMIVIVENYTDINVAYGKTVNYLAVDMSRAVEMSDTLMTDALIDSEDPVNTADCPSLTREGGAYLSVNLGESLPVRVVGIFGKKGKFLIDFPMIASTIRIS